MDIAIVTGASSALGLAISRRLIQLGFRVYGLGGDYTDYALQNVNFRPVNCNLADPEAVEAAAKRILEKEKGVLVLVNNAKFYGNTPFWEMDCAEMDRVLKINLLCPLILARVLSDTLRILQGYIINLGSLTVETTRGGPVGASAAGGLKWMSEVLFQDLRQSGVKVCQLSPEPNRARDPRTVARADVPLSATIDPEAVAQAVEQILQSPFGNIVTEMVLRPLRVKEPNHDPVVNLPYPEPKPVPYTVPRELIEAEEQLEEEEFRENQRKRRQRQRDRSKATSEPANTEKRQTEDKPRHVKPDEEKPPQEAASESPKRRRSRRKPRPPKAEVGFHKEEKRADPPPKPEPQPDPPAQKKGARKTPAKKATKKASRKSPAKKAASQRNRKPATKAAEARDSGNAVKRAPRKRAARKSSRNPKQENPED